MPLTTVEIGSRRFGACGGGYLRLFPLRYTQYAVRQLHEAGDPVILYLHPYELEPRPQITSLPGFPSAQSMSFRFFNFHQCVGRKSVESKVRWLLENHRFGTIRAVGGLARTPTGDGRRGGGSQRRVKDQGNAATGQSARRRGNQTRATG